MPIHGIADIFPSRAFLLPHDCQRKKNRTDFLVASQNALEVTQQALRSTQEDLKDAEAVTAGEIDARLLALQAELVEAKVSNL